MIRVRYAAYSGREYLGYVEVAGIGDHAAHALRQARLHIAPHVTVREVYRLGRVSSMHDDGTVAHHAPLI